MNSVKVEKITDNPECLSISIIMPDLLSTPIPFLMPDPSLVLSKTFIWI
jgi:hypothetical protein